MLSIWFVGGCLLVSMGVVGEYNIVVSISR